MITQADRDQAAADTVTQLRAARRELDAERAVHAETRKERDELRDRAAGAIGRLEHELLTPTDTWADHAREAVRILQEGYGSEPGEAQDAKLFKAAIDRAERADQALARIATWLRDQGSETDAVTIGRVLAEIAKGTETPP